MTLRRSALALAAAAVLAATAGSCGAEPDGSDPTPAGTIPAGNATEAPLLPTSVDGLPMMDPDGFQELMGQLEGTPVLVNFWGSWCPPCRDEMPRLVAAHDEWGDRVQFLGVDIEDSRSGARDFMDEFGMTFPSVFDPPDAIKTSLGHFGQPVTAFYRSDGTLEFSWTGPIQPDVLEQHLRAIAG
jgi:cytochrome c biogenesis protein CcmG/thiol:disulfide interchange protein DsbE